MRTIANITEEEARHIALLLDVEFLKLVTSKKIILIGINSTNKNWCYEEITIESTGLVFYFFYDELKSCNRHKIINCLPITDYLRSVEIDFEY